MSPTTPVGLRREAIDSYAQLVHAIADLNDRGDCVPCQREPAAWVADEPATRAEAAEACQLGCPLIAECDQYAEAQGERHGCWGGVDRTPRPTGRHDQEDDDQ